ncbi:MAG TPA: hypothetical protein PJ986_16590 [Gammaproteobacteria bacterium]|nr:hypothetical protein [Gammaproteobacteria bacterium]
MNDRTVNFIDTTCRDGVQSLWALQATHGMFDAVAGELDQAGFSRMEILQYGGYFKMVVRVLKEDPWATLRMWKEKTPHTPKVELCLGAGSTTMDLFGRPEPLALAQLWHRTTIAANGASYVHLIACTTDEVKDRYPSWIPFFRSLGLKIVIQPAYTVSPRHTDEYYAGVVRDVLKYEPDAIAIKDACGLLTPERTRSLTRAMIDAANGIPIELHTHCTTTFAPACFVEAMQQGVRTFWTCVPPLAYGSSHPSIFDAIHNAQVLGFETTINEKPLRIVEERLTRIAKLEGLPIGAPEPYDHRQYVHSVPGGVISNLRLQLQTLGMAHKLDAVLDEVPRITAELGYPIMITPHSQFIVAQAAVNVATGERYKDVLDSMTEFALGVYGIEDAGVPYMDQNLKDRFLSTPRAKQIARDWERQKQEYEQLTVKQIRARHGMLQASDEDFLLYYIMKGDEEIRQMRAAGPPQTYYTGNEPLGLLLKELSKHRDVSRLHMQKGSSVFDFRRAASRGG